MGKPVTIEFVSMLKLMLDAAVTASMERGFQVGGSLSEAAKAAGLPDPLRNIDLDKSLRLYLTRIAYPASCMLPPEMVAAMDKAAAQKAQVMQAGQAGMAAVSAAQGLSNVQVGGGKNAIEAVLGQPGAGEQQAA